MVTRTGAHSQFGLHFLHICARQMQTCEACTNIALPVECSCGHASCTSYVGGIEACKIGAIVKKAIQPITAGILAARKLAQIDRPCPAMDSAIAENLKFDSWKAFRCSPGLL